MAALADLDVTSQPNTLPGQYINAQTGTTYTLALTDAGGLVTLDNGSAIALTVPANADVAFQVGTKIYLGTLGAGTVTVAGDVGVTINSDGGLAIAQNQAGMLWKYATNTWLFMLWAAGSSGIPASTLSAKGSLVGATAASTPADVAVGTDGYALVGDSAASTGVSYKRRAVVQVANAEYATKNTTSTTIPIDDTIPQNTEGAEFFSLAFTPTSATNKLRIEVLVFLSPSAGNNVVAALFQDSTADALAAQIVSNTNAFGIMCKIEHWMTAGTTSATTFKVRCGPGSGTLTINGIANTRYLGGVAKSSITITEIVP